MSARLHNFYKEKVAADLMQKFGYKSVMEVPRITKITLNMGLGEAVNDKKIIEHAVGDLTKIAGQNPSRLPNWCNGYFAWSNNVRIP